MASFAARLRADRENAGLTIRQLADQVGISFAYVSRLELAGAGSHLSSKIVVDLAKALGADELEYLYLSGIVPAPLGRLLADAQSRSFVRALLRTRPTPSGWDHLETALAKLRPKRPASKRKAR